MKHNKGFVALAAVLILSAIFLSVAISIASRAISQLDADLALYERDIARYSAEACAEVALMELQRELEYEGNEEAAIDDRTCEVWTIPNTGQSRTFMVYSEMGNHIYQSEIAITDISPEMVLSTFKRVEN